MISQIPAGQGRTALDREVGEDAQKAGVAALVMLKHHDLARGVQRGVKVLQKQFFRAGVGGSALPAAGVRRAAAAVPSSLRTCPTARPAR